MHSNAGSAQTAGTHDTDYLRTAGDSLARKPFLRRIYAEWYATLAAAVPDGCSPALELGAGAGGLGEYVPNLLKSDIQSNPNVSLLLDGCELPFKDRSLRAIVMTDVFHHLPDAGQFLREAARCVDSGGVVAMVEPWVTPWSRFVYNAVGHEPFDPKAEAWTTVRGRPISGSNQALAWIVFRRDREQFVKLFPQWEVTTLEPCMPFRYILSGGVSKPALMPASLFGTWRFLERCLTPAMPALAMFAQIVLTRRSA